MSAGSRAERLVRLAYQTGEGQLEALSCPDCGAPSVRAHFTRIEPPVADRISYAVWFACDRCPFESRAACMDARPPHFDETLISARFQAKELDLWRRMTSDDAEPTDP